MKKDKIKIKDSSKTKIKDSDKIKIKNKNSNKIELSFHEKINFTKESFLKIKDNMINFDNKINEEYIKNSDKFKIPNFRYYSNHNLQSIYNKKYAFVTSVFISEDYIPGALVLAQSLRKVNTKYPIICMVQDKPYEVNKNTTFKGVSEKGIKDLLELFDMVIGVDLLKVKNFTKNNKYSHLVNNPSYKNILYYVTKGQILALTQFKKLLYFDASSFIVKNIDYIFNKYNKPTFQYDTEYKISKVGYHGANFFLIPKITYYYKLLSFIKNYKLFFNNLYFCRTVDELLIFFSIYPSWDKNKLPFNFRCSTKKLNLSCSIYHFQIIKPFRPISKNIKFNDVPFEKINEWNHHAKNIIEKKPNLISYYKHIPEFRKQEIFI